MDRALLRKFVGSCLLISAAACAAGCSVIPTIAYIIKPEDVAAEFDGLNGKRVAVICRATSLDYAQPTVGRELGVLVGRLVAKHGRKVEVVDDRELSDWVDKHDWHDYRDIGRAMKADMVLGIDLERFDVKLSSTVLQGQADVRMTAYDVKKNMVVWEKRPQTIKFPTNSFTTDREESEFKRQFIGVLAERVAHHFYAYDSRKDFASDSLVLH
jgi:hypothetical protein